MSNVSVHNVIDIIDFNVNLTIRIYDNIQGNMGTENGVIV